MYRAFIDKSTKFVFGKRPIGSNITRSDLGQKL